VDYPKAGENVAALNAALAGEHALVVNVSDARAVFRVTGPRCREVMAKLTPANVATDAFAPGQWRRTRLAQVAAAFHMPDAESFEIVCFRSVAQYMFDLLSNAARTGGEVGVF
jgi:sarcosine oxidase subunit gamma